MKRRGKAPPFKTEEEAVEALVPLLTRMVTHLIRGGASVDVVLAAWLAVYTNVTIELYGEKGAVEHLLNMAETLPAALLESHKRYDPLDKTEPEGSA